MTRRKHGIGRHYGRSKSNMKKKSSVTAAGIAAAAAALAASAATSSSGYGISNGGELALASEFDRMLCSFVDAGMQSESESLILKFRFSEIFGDDRAVRQSFFGHDLGNKVDWREQRAIQSRDKKIQHLSTQNSSLKTEVSILEKKLSRSEKICKQEKKHRIDAVAFTKAKLSKKISLQSKEIARALNDSSNKSVWFKSTLAKLKESECLKRNELKTAIELRSDAIASKKEKRHIRQLDALMNTIEAKDAAADKVKCAHEAAIAELSEHHDSTLLNVHATHCDELKQQHHEHQAELAKVNADFGEKLNQANDRTLREKQIRIKTVSSVHEKLCDTRKKCASAVASLCDDKKMKALDANSKCRAYKRQKVEAQRELKAVAKHAKATDNLHASLLSEYCEQQMEMAITEEEIVQSERKVNELQEKLVKTQELLSAAMPAVVIGKVRVTKGTARGGGLTWPLWINQLIFEQLVNGTPPTAIWPNILSQALIFNPNTIIKDLPSLSYIRGCRTTLRVVAETLAAYRLAKLGLWKQLFSDGTSRRQIALQNLVIRILNDHGELVPLILSTSIIPKDESSESVCDAILQCIRNGAKRLQRWAEVTNRLFPDFDHDIPGADEMNIGKLGMGGANTSDTCNGARKTRRLVTEKIIAAAQELSLNSNNGNDVSVIEQDCWNHMRNVWLGAVGKSLTKYLNIALKEYLVDIDPRLRVTTSMEALLRAIDKEFSLTANYPKGHGDLFKTWMEIYYSGVLLLHCARASGSRQDLLVEGAGAVYWNRKYWIEFLDERLSTPGKDDNILQQNLFIILQSSEMTALSRVCAIIHLAICLPVRWLAGNSHHLSRFGWSVRSMGRVIDLLEPALEEIKMNGKKFLDEDFMMGIFSELLNTIPPFREYWDFIFEEKQTATVGSTTDKMLPFDQLRAELFYPQSKTNQDTTEMVEALAVEVAKAILTELRDPNKATSNYLTSASGKFSWGYTSAADKVSGLGKCATNDDAERPFGGLTSELQRFGRIGLTNAGGITQARVNGDFYRSKSKKGDDVVEGLFHQLPTEMKQSLFATAMEDAPVTIKADSEALARQRDSKRMKEEVLRQRGFMAAKENLVDAIVYHKMYGSLACWMTERAVDSELIKLGSKTAQLRHLKEQIKMRVLGLGWDQFQTTWSKNGIEKTPKELATHLKNIIREGRSLEVPIEPPARLPTRKELPALGTVTQDVLDLDASRASKHQEFVESAEELRCEREAVGMGDLRGELQPTSHPPIDKSLVGKRIEMLFQFTENGTGENKFFEWCKGIIKRVSDGKNLKKTRAFYKPGEAVEIEWDTEYVEDGNPNCTTHVLLKSKWNPNVHNTEGSWRLDVG